MPEITRRRLLGAAAVGAGGILAQSVLPPGLARAASLSPGETWIGDQRADYRFIIEQSDPAHPRTQDAVWQGRKCIAFSVYNEDLGPDANPPDFDKNPRTQAETSTFIKRGGHYIIDHFAYITRKNLPTWHSHGWLNLWEKYGDPFGGSPALSVSSHDGQHWGFVRGEPPWNVNYESPIKFDSWQQWTFNFVNADPGKLTVSLNGKTVFSDPAYRNITDSEKDGDWMTIPHLYMERDNVVANGVRVGPIWMYDTVRQLG